MMPVFFIFLGGTIEKTKVTRIFCSNCGSAISQLTIALGDSQSIQTGNFREFAEVPITKEGACRPAQFLLSRHC
jgi:hypothetical protein